MGTSPLIYKYPLDLTGMNPTNRVVNEPHVLPTGANRAIVPNYGAFYTDSLKVFDSQGNELVVREQFIATQLYQEATLKTGLEVCTVVVVTDTDVSPDISIEYQAIGGEFSYSVQSLREMIESLDLDNRPVSWGSILGKPDAFPPAPHLHDAGDLYGFEYLTEAIASLRRAILVGNEATVVELSNRINELAIMVMEKATVEEAISGQRNDVVMTPYTTKLAFAAWLDELTYGELNNHIYDYNPHETKALHVGLSGLESKTLLDVIGAETTAKNAIPPKS